LSPSWLDCGGPVRLQPTADLVLAGGAVVCPARAAGVLSAAGIRARARGSLAASPPGLGPCLSIGPRNPLLRTARGCPAGGVAAVGLPPPKARVPGGRSGRGVRPGAAGAGDQSELNRARELDRESIAEPAPRSTRPAVRERVSGARSGRDRTGCGRARGA